MDWNYAKLHILHSSLSYDYPPTTDAALFTNMIIVSNTEAKGNDNVI